MKLRNTIRPFDRRTTEATTKYKAIAEHLTVTRRHAHVLAGLTDHIEVAAGRRLTTPRSHSHGLIGLNVAVDVVVASVTNGTFSASQSQGTLVNESRISSPWHYRFQDTECMLYSASGGSVLAYDVRHWHLLADILSGATDDVTPIARALRMVKHATSTFGPLDSADHPAIDSLGGAEPRQRIDLVDARCVSREVGATS